MARNLLIFAAVALAGCGNLENLDGFPYEGPATTGSDTGDDGDTADVPFDTAADIAPDADHDAPGDTGDIDDANDSGETGDVEEDGGDADLPDGDDLGCPECATQLFGGNTGDSMCAVQDGATYCWGDNSNLQLADPNRELLVRYPQRVSTIGNVRFASGGGQHVCAVTVDDELWCWGSNSASQLGLPGPDSGLPRRVMSSVTTVATGTAHTCATGAAGVYCWGSNERGQTGAPRPSGSETLVHEPALVTGTGSALEVVGGHQFNCTITNTDRVDCWGDNTAGQLGTEPNQTRCGAPNFGSCSATKFSVDLEGAPHSVSLGVQHGCAATSSGLFCWGLNSQFQTSPDAGADTHIPALVTTPDGFDLPAGVVSGSHHNCALNTSGQALCWGVNQHGRAGQPEEQGAIPRPALVDLPAPVHQLAGGWRHTCAIQGDGEDVYCWGDGLQGQIGVGFVFPGPTPQPVDLHEAQQITAGGEFTCAVRDGSLYCWGDNESGQIGDGVPVQQPAPFGIPTRLEFTTIQTSATHSCALTDDGTIYCWGNNQKRAFGIEAVPWTSTPTRSGVPRTSSLAVGHGYGCAVDNGGSLYCWGSNDCGQAGRPQSQVQLPEEVGGIWRRVAAGLSHTCAIDNEGTVHCWGGNEYGQAGLTGGAPGCWQSSAFRSPTETDIAEVRALSLGNWHSCALTLGGEVLCWGLGTSGQLGRPQLPVGGASSEAISVGLTGVAQIAASAEHTCARTEAGEVYCWGSAEGGRLGAPPDNLGCDGTCQRTPRKIDTLSGVVDIAVTASSTCAALANGEVWCWGHNNKGQLGIGSYEGQTAPTRVQFP